MSSKNELIINLLHVGKTPTEISEALHVNRVTVYKVKNKFNATGSVNRRPGSGRHRSVRTVGMVKSIRSKIRYNPVRSMRRMAREAGVSEKTIRRIVHEDLGAKSRARTKKHLINGQTMVKRFQRSKVLLTVLKGGQLIIFFTDEKVFTIDSTSNSRHDRYISKERPDNVPDNVKYTFRSKHPASVMVFGLVASDGKKMPPVFIQSGMRINAEMYLEILRNHVKPWIEANYPPGTRYVFQQDGAPAHTAKKTQDWLRGNLVSFWTKEMWPPSSPDLNPLDYSIWAYVEKGACQKPHSSVPALKTAITKFWNSMDAEYIKKTCGAFRRRLEGVIKANGGHIE